MTLICKHCTRVFDSREGYLGNAEEPYCLEKPCENAYFAVFGIIRDLLSRIH